jgi:hypothetical protein
MRDGTAGSTKTSCTARPDHTLGSKAEELTASTTGLLHPWELTIQQTLRLGGSGPDSEIVAWVCLSETDQLSTSAMACSNVGPRRLGGRENTELPRIGGTGPSPTRHDLIDVQRAEARRRPFDYCRVDLSDLGVERGDPTTGGRFVVVLFDGGEFSLHIAKQFERWRQHRNLLALDKLLHPPETGRNQQCTDRAEYFRLASHSSVRGARSFWTCCDQKAASMVPIAFS